jgi:subtilisin-like proprotein convertase family protein
MKANLTTILGGMVCGLALGLGTASASISTFSTSPGTTVPDGNSTGIASTINVSGQGSVLVSVSVTLNISGGYNGDLVAYLNYGGTSVTLLDRPGLLTGGMGTTPGVGYTTAGYNNVTLSSGNLGNINTTASPATDGTGTYNPAGTGGVTFANFQTMNPNGNWVLTIADLNGNDTSFSSLDSWSLNLDAVPEPVNVALGIFAALMLAVAGFRRFRRLHRA